MKRRYWVIPPLLALAGYFSADAVMDRRDASRAGAGKMTGGERVVRPKFTMEQALEEYEAEDVAKEPPKEPGMEELKQRILDLRKGLAGLSEQDEDYGELQGYHYEELESAAYQLGRRERAAGCEWIAEAAPELRLLVFDAWAHEEPEAAWQAIVRSERQPPCDINTLMMMLGKKAQESPHALKQACLEVPWDLFQYCDERTFDFRVDRNFTSFEPQMSYGHDVQVWLESGAARTLAEKGVPVQGFFEIWSEREPVAALKAWSEWPATSQHGIQLVGMLSVNVSPDAPAEEIISVLGSLTPELRAEAAEEVKKHLLTRGRHESDLRMYHAVLGIASPDDEP
jgi:hypothetical protein